LKLYSAVYCDLSNVYGCLKVTVIELFLICGVRFIVLNYFTDFVRFICRFIYFPWWLHYHHTEYSI